MAVTRSTNVNEATPRYAILGATSFTDIEVSVAVSRNAGLGIDKFAYAYARWTDANNHAFLKLRLGGYSGTGLGPPPPRAWLSVRIAGVETILDTVPVAEVLQPDTAYTLRLICFAGGQVRATVLDSAGGTLLTLKGQHTALATGGTLQTGKPGFGDQSVGTGGAGALTRTYTAFYAGPSAPEPIACYPSQSIEFRSDATLREDATGVYAGAPPEYVGARFFVPNAGGPGRKTRVAVLVRRNDVEAAADNDVVANATMDSTTVQAYATPRYLVVPR